MTPTEAWADWLGRHSDAFRVALDMALSGGYDLREVAQYHRLNAGERRDLVRIARCGITGYPPGTYDLIGRTIYVSPDTTAMVSEVSGIMLRMQSAACIPVPVVTALTP